MGLSGIMADAGLTNGAFYTHFASKDDLVRETLVHALEAQEIELKTLADASGNVVLAIRNYLSARHRDNAGSGCPSASLLGEVGRQPIETREAYTDCLVSVIDLIAAALPGNNPDINPGDARRRALAIFGLMAGTLQLSRAVTDISLSNEILEAGASAAIALAGQQPTPPDRETASS